MLAEYALVIMLAIMVATTVAGLPIGISMIVSSVFYLLLAGRDIGLASEHVLNGIFDNFVALAVPLFIFAANIMNAGRITDRLLDFALAMVGRLPGGLAQVNILTSLIFSDMSGSAVSDVAGVGKILVRMMTEENRYPPGYAGAVTAASAIADSLGCAGAGIETPNLDALAAGGTRFATCTVNNPICTPSRASIFTGKELPGHGVYRLHDRLPDAEVLFADRLRTEAGYRTALFGELHVSGRAVEEAQRHPHDGFEDYEWCLESCVSMDSRFNGYVAWLRDRDPDFLADLRARQRRVTHHPEAVHFTRWAAGRSIDYIRERSRRGEHFLCVMSIFDPHNPYEDYPLGVAGRVHGDRIPAPTPRSSLPAAAIRERDGSYLGADFSPDAIRDMRFGYGASIAFADQEIGRVLATLEECGIADETLVIFMSDHGDQLGDHGMMVKGVALYEPTINVPLIVRWPGRVAAGQVSTALAQGHDLARTCCAAAGFAPRRDGPFDTGQSLLDLAAGAATRRAAVSAYRNSGINRANAYWDPPMLATAVRGPREKLIAYTSRDEVEYEFFDLAEDPREQENRFGDSGCGDRIHVLFRELAGWLQREAMFAGSRGGGRFPSSDSFIENAIPKS